MILCGQILKIYFFDSSKLFAFLRYYEDQVLLVIVNFSDDDLSYKLKIPAHAMQMTGLNPDSFYKGKDLLEFCKTIQFPGVVAINAGFGGRIKGRGAAIFRLKSQPVA